MRGGDSRRTRSSTSGPTTNAVWSPVYVDALVLRDRDTDTDGTLDERLYVAQDANYNVTAIFDNSGTVVERYVYDPFGQATVLTPAWEQLTSSLFAWQHLHQGLRFESAIGLYDSRARWYSATQMRFISGDPVWATNLYVGYGNAPAGAVDPGGMQQYTELTGRPIGSGWVRTGVRICWGYLYLGGGVSMPLHVFVAVGNTGYGFFAPGKESGSLFDFTGSVISTEFDHYPIDQQRSDLWNEYYHRPPPGFWDYALGRHRQRVMDQLGRVGFVAERRGLSRYSVCIDVLVHPDSYDPVRFRAGVLAYINTRLTNPDAYSVFHTCHGFVSEAIRSGYRNAATFEARWWEGHFEATSP